MALTIPTAGRPSGTYGFAPDIATLVEEAYSRIQIYAPEMTIEHIYSARVSLGLMQMDLSGNRGPNLFLIDQLAIPLVPAEVVFTLPANTIDLLDCYVRTYTPQTNNGANVAVNVGAVITAIGPPSNPIVSQPYGDVALSTPPSGTLSCTAGSEIMSLLWPAHGKAAGDPIFLNSPIVIGGLTIYNFIMVYNVIDSNNLQFIAPVPALETQTFQGATPLLFTPSAGSTIVNIISSGHGLSVGMTYNLPSAVVLGARTVAAGNYVVTAVSSPYQFTIAPAGFVANAAAMNFINGGQLSFTSQQPGNAYEDVPLYPLSRTDYVNLAVKAVPGRPTSYWLDRIVPPQFSIYPVAPLPGSATIQPPGIPTSGNQYYGFLGYRMREMQDATPVGGVVFDAPRRFWPAITAELAAALAEKWRPAQWQAKTLAARDAWDRAQSADTEHVTTHLTPNFGTYYR